MNLDDVPEVVVDHSGGHKFIVAKVIDGNGGEKLVIRANKKYGFHDDIFDQLWAEIKLSEISLSNLRASCIGGGRININLDTKVIRIWGYSEAYGEEPDRQQTVRMLQSVFPDFEITSQSSR